MAIAEHMIDIGPGSQDNVSGNVKNNGKLLDREPYRTLRAENRAF